MTEAAILADLSADNIRRHVEQIAMDIPYRAAGSANGQRMAEYSRDAMRAAGLVDAALHEFPAVVSFPEHAECRVVAPVEISLQANTLGHSLLTIEDGIEGELLDVGGGGFSDYAGKDARGKIILTELSYSPARHEKQRIAAMKGAIGAVMMNWGHPENTAVPFGSVKPVWGNPTPDNVTTEMPTIPCIGIARTAGLRLRDLLGKGSVKLRFRTHVENGWRPVQITTANLPAPEASPEAADFVLVGGHQDSWPGEAATDNAAGNACLMELARVFNLHREQLRRGITFGFWTAHETGTMAGSSWFCDRNWDRLRANCVAYLQVDQPAFVGTTEWSTASNAELKPFLDAVEKRLLGTKRTKWRRSVKNGDASFFGIGIPMFHAEGSFTEAELRATAMADLGWWHHSVENRLDKMDWTLMQEHIRVYGAYLWELCTAPVLPFRFAPVAEQVVARLQELAPAGSTVGLESTLAAANRFAAEAARLDTRAATEASAFAAGRGSEDAAQLLNATMKRLSRILVPLQSTAIGTYGHDPYGFTPQTTMIPCLYNVPELATLPAGEARWMLETKLVRARNRVADAMVDSSAVISEALTRLG
ncbi:M28 family peptidase [Elioraea sp.]|uniref:M28 family peptidase n=1 Tax=Elioraea sp. TaxID=2185103 RepID=UPI0025BAE32B|nr:M28 family peptidase [Elioraea sp.]